MVVPQTGAGGGAGRYETAPEMLLACRDCGLLHRVATRLLARHRESCARCGASLLRLPPGGFDRPLAIAAAAVILFLIANAYPIFTVTMQGSERSNLLISGAVDLVRYGGMLGWLGLYVGLLSIVIPGVRLALIVAVLLGLRQAEVEARFIGSGPAAPGLAVAWKTAVALRPWSMLDVYLLGAFVAYSRLHNYVDTTVGVGGYALAGFVVMDALLLLSLGRGRVWDALGDPTAYTPNAGDAWVRCPDCELVVAAGERARDGAGARPPFCPRCGGRLAPRHRGSLAVAAAMTIAAMILYLPANLLPVMTLVWYGSDDTNTILSGVQELIDLGMWPLAVLVFFASITVPVLKLASISWFLLAIRRGSAALLRQRTSLYRLIDFVGRWSNIDVFMISILVPLVQFGTLTTVYAEIGAVSFAAVVALTMIATRAFDPRIMWDAASEKAP